jgi:hypothetical protein
VIIRIVGHDLPGRACGPGPEFPEGHHEIHVAVQGRKGQADLFGLVPADVETATWDLACTVIAPPPAVDVRGPQIQGSPGKRFVYLTWGVVNPLGTFRMFRRAKVWLGAVPADIMAAAVEGGTLVGTLGLTDDHGRPLCASVRPPRIIWSVPHPA